MCVTLPGCVTFDEEHLEHGGALVQQDGLALGDDHERALFRGGQASPGEPGRPHVDVEEVGVILEDA